MEMEVLPYGTSHHRWKSPCCGEGLIYQEVLSKCVNEETLTERRSYNRQVSSTVMSRPELILIRQD